MKTLTSHTSRSALPPASIAKQIGHLSTYAIYALIGATAVGCAAAGSGQPNTRRASQSNIGADPIVLIPAPTPTPTPTSSPVPAGVDPLYSFEARAVGYTSLSLQVPANRVLKLRFTPGLQDRTVAGTGFSPTYSKLAVFLTVGSQTRATPLLSNGLTGEVESSPIMDFSSAFTKLCVPADIECRQYVTVTISKPNNDYFCHNYGTYCTHAQMYSTHPWNGVLEIQTDDTIALQ